MAIKATKKRARTKTGHFEKDDPNTPENEAWVDEKSSKVEAHIWFESREREPSMFSVAGINPIRNFLHGTLEWKVSIDDVTRFEANHFVQNARVVKKRGS
jgi:hypothetical protein